MPGGRVKLQPSRGSGLTLLVAKPPDRSGGVGGWQSSERSGRRPAKWFKALPDDTYSWELILDLNEVGGPDMHRRLRVLRDMGQPGDQDEPPTIRIEGDLWDHDASLDWVMQDLSLGERLYAPDGSLVRQTVTVGLERHTPLDEVEAITVRTTRTGRTAKTARRRTVTAKGMDTLRVIALRELGDGTRWKDLQRWNKNLKRVDPDASLRTGLHIVVR